MPVTPKGGMKWLVFGTRDVSQRHRTERLKLTGGQGWMMTRMYRRRFSLDEKHTVFTDAERAEWCPANLDRLMQSGDGPVTFLTECFMSALSKAAPPHSPAEEIHWGKAEIIPYRLDS